MEIFRNPWWGFSGIGGGELSDSVVVIYRNGWWIRSGIRTQQGLAIPEPGDLLFVESWIYRWGLWFEQSLAAYYTGHLDEAREANARVLSEPSVPEPWRSQAQANEAWWR